MRRLEKTAPEAFKNLKVIWKSPLIPSDPLVWRKDLDKDIKAKIYTFVMSYGRIGSPEDVESARKTLKLLQWAPFRPSSDAQLYPIRILAINKEILKIQSSTKLSEADKKAKVAELQKKSEASSMLAEKVPGM